MYITQKLSIDQMYNIAINDIPGQQYDPLTQLRSRTFYGRPDFPSIYSRLRDAVELGAFLGPREARQVPHIGTFFCGVGLVCI
jgi:NADPH oxidase